MCSFYTSRWLRLLFGREYALPDLLVLWDALFADGRGASGLTNYVVVAMLVQIRQRCKCMLIVWTLNIPKSNHMACRCSSTL